MSHHKKGSPLFSPAIIYIIHHSSISKVYNMNTLPTIFCLYTCILSTWAWLTPQLPSIQSLSLYSLPSSIKDGNKDDDLKKMGLNELQTSFRRAVEAQDYDQAKLLSDLLADRISQGAYRSPINNQIEDRIRKRKRMSWKGLGTAPWLQDRLDSLGFKFPTTIQINSMESVNAILSSLEDDGIESTKGTDNETLEQLLERKGTPGLNMGIVVSGSTGSGKTLGYIVPMLSTLSESLFARQRIRVKSEEDIGDVAQDLLARIAVQTSPTVRGHGRQQVGSQGQALATGAALSSLGKSGSDVKSPLALIVVPTRELGVQTALLLYELVGGSNKKKASDLSGLKNMFKYKGPKGVKIGCILDDEEAQFGLKLQTDVAITTPKYLPKLVRDGDVIPSKLRVVVYDEADLTLEQTSEEDLNALFRDTELDRSLSRLSFLVGASVTESLGKLCVKDSVLPKGMSFIATATRFAPLVIDDNDDSTKMQSFDTASKIERTEYDLSPLSTKATLKDLGLCLDQGLRHERVVAKDDTGMVCLARMLRKELRQFEDDANMSKNQSLIIQRPRVVVFFPSEDAARAAIIPLRDALWGDHKLCVLLPNTGVSPLAIMEQFKAGETSVMLATPNSVRGLDFVDLTHVYTLYLPADDPREYLHLAGRVGRIGQSGSVTGTGGRVTSILRTNEAEKFVNLAKLLNFSYVDVDYVIEDVSAADDVEKIRRYLEDKLTLLNLVDEPIYASSRTNIADISEKDSSDDEDDEDEDDDIDEDESLP